MKRFKFVVPQKPYKLPIEKPPLQELPNTSLPKLVKAYNYKPQPNKRQVRQYNLNNDPNVPAAVYIQHRQQDWGRAIAQGRDAYNRLVARQGNVWTFQHREYGSDTETTYTVTWDGRGTPVAGLSTSTYSQGKIYYRYGNPDPIQLQGQPDKYTWCVWFLVNGIPPDDKWIPTPSRNPSWQFEPAWVEYPE